MMVERECGVIKGAKFPTLWNPPVTEKIPRLVVSRRDPFTLILTLNSQGYLSSQSLTITRYRNKITGCFEREPTGLHGGILADVSLLFSSISE